MRATRATLSPAASPCAAAGESFTALSDQFGRRLNYLRLSVTDRCNLRCRYCMPSGGLPLTPRSDILSWEEMLRLCRVCGAMGVRKIRLTGGEPLVRKGLLAFMADLRAISAAPDLYLTTNGTLLGDHLSELKSLAISRLNISIDSLRPEIYARIARRDDFDRVWRAVNAADAAGFGVKLNVVVLGGMNEDEIPDFVALTRERSWTVRFIEAMPFNGQGGRVESRISGDEILRRIRARYELQSVAARTDGVDTLYRVPGHQGQVGIIFGHSRRFCGRCSRLRISAQGALRTCLYDGTAADLRRLLRSGATDAAIAGAVRQAVARRHRDGLTAEVASRHSATGSMAEIGG